MCDIIKYQVNKAGEGKAFEMKGLGKTLAFERKRLKNAFLFYFILSFFLFYLEPCLGLVSAVWLHNFES